MASLYGTTINTSKGTYNVKVEVLVFEKEGTFFVYSPSFNLISCGDTQTDALTEFNSIFVSHIKFCTDKGTLEEDLKANGWEIIDGKYIPPKRKWMKENNDIYRDILENENYQIKYETYNLSAA
ncbi:MULTISPECIES: hypothetical protein [Butyricimonas]|uniref:hypothetical protein n=1 Tax=Butyricimonas TaxID=574697 RepID=UPI001D094395|nr:MULTISPECIES: hypothetical protein [Butyricimonas]MCB6974571.1 hypothetical protein [Butyricimonas synergistica]MCG4518307.1 hypothetical protein [Butyricimonas sp. DFI.6.44]